MMQQHYSVSVVFLVAFVIGITFSSSDFIEEPQSTNVLLNGTAVFRCECVSCLTVLWHFNNKTAQTSKNEAAGIIVDGPYNGGVGGNKYSLLNVTAKEMHNNSIIQCFSIEYDHQQVQSDLAYLKCQGPLGPPGQIEVNQLNSSSITVSFTPPFTLENVSILYYSIEISNISTSVKIAISTLLEYNLTLASNCEIYTVTITPHNGLGAGMSQMFDFILYGDPVLQFPVDIFLNKQYEVMFHLFFNTMCIGTIPVYSVITWNCTSPDCSEANSSSLSICLNETSTHYFSKEIKALPQICSTPNATVASVNLTNVITEGEMYMVDIFLYTLSDYQYNQTIEISTFHVTAVDFFLSDNNHSVCIGCTLNIDSADNGCVVLFKGIQDPSFTFIINRSQENYAYQCIKHLPAGVYSAYITDLILYNKYQFNKVAFQIMNCCTIIQDNISTGQPSISSSLITTDVLPVASDIVSSPLKSPKGSGEIIPQIDDNATIILSLSIGIPLSCIIVSLIILSASVVLILIKRFNRKQTKIAEKLNANINFDANFAYFSNTAIVESENTQNVIIMNDCNAYGVVNSSFEHN